MMNTIYNQLNIDVYPQTQGMTQGFGAWVQSLAAQWDASYDTLNDQSSFNGIKQLAEARDKIERQLKAAVQQDRADQADIFGPQQRLAYHKEVAAKLRWSCCKVWQLNKLSCTARQFFAQLQCRLLCKVSGMCGSVDCEPCMHPLTTRSL
jgi:hypothetical protein